MIPQSGTLSDTILNACFTLLKGVPTEWASAIGSFGYRMNGRLARKDSIESLKRNFRLLRPEASAAELEGWVDDFYDAVGRVETIVSFHPHVQNNYSLKILLTARMLSTRTRTHMSFALICSYIHRNNATPTAVSMLNL